MAWFWANACGLPPTTEAEIADYRRRWDEQRAACPVCRGAERSTAPWACCGPINREQEMIEQEWADHLDSR